MSNKYAMVILDGNVGQSSHVTVTPTEQGMFLLGSTLEQEDLVIKFDEDAYVNFLVAIKGKDPGEYHRMFGPGLSGNTYKMQVGSTTVPLTREQVDEFVSLVVADKCTPELIREESMRLAAASP